MCARARPNGTAQAAPRATSPHPMGHAAPVVRGIAVAFIGLGHAARAERSEFTGPIDDRGTSPKLKQIRRNSHAQQTPSYTTTHNHRNGGRHGQAHSIDSCKALNPVSKGLHDTSGATLAQEEGKRNSDASRRPFAVVLAVTGIVTVTLRI